MEIILHRRNKVSEIQHTDPKYGVEIDVRSAGDFLYLHHDPLVRGTKLEDWLKYFKHGTLILNVKEEGLEGHLLELMKEFNIRDFFFLDQSIPFLIKTALKRERRCAVRVSEYEGTHTALKLANLIDWVWVDCFHSFPLDSQEAKKLRHAGLKLCIVSPELQGRTNYNEIVELKKTLIDLDIAPDAVCTKSPEFWERP